MFYYRLLLALTSPLIFFYFSFRYVTNSSYRRHFAERLGILPERFCETKPDSIWIHAVSVGEVASAMPLARELRQRLPDIALYLSVGTVAGRKIAESQGAGLLDGVFYAPVDFVFAVRRVLRTIRPNVCIILETEIWPNLFFQTKAAGVGLVMANARISDRTWPRYRQLRWLFQAIVAIPDRIYTQSREDFVRFRALGISESKLTVEPNLKYDAAADPTRLDLPAFGASQVWIAASTVGPDERGSLWRHSVHEEEEVLEVFRDLAATRPGLLLVIAPRQPHRFNTVAELVAKSGFPYRRRSKMGEAGSLKLPGILLLDTLGELARVYHLAAAVFVGGSLAPRGGHNILEPAMAGVPVVVGPHMQNFPAICRDFLAAGALEQVADTAGLRAAMRRLLDSPEEARALGARGEAVARSKTGVAARLADQLVRYRATRHFRRPRLWLTRLLLGSAALLWTAGGVVKRRRAERVAAGRPRLGPPVVSVGGLTVGGSGKTPFANYLASSLRRRGFHPAILTRGYRRRSPARCLVMEPGASISTAFTGDEAQIYLRTGDAAVGIGADRYETGRVLLRHVPATDVLLLDDGFQHARLPRDLDIVMIDGLDPFGGEQVMPAGHAREPMAALARADVFVLTRCPSREHVEGLTERLREFNPAAPVFESRLRIVGWRDAESGAQIELAGGIKVAAFCGLGNPKNFFGTLGGMGLNVVSRTTFGDHHAYRLLELQRLADVARRHGAAMLVTTEKDRVNFPAQAGEALAGMKTAWLEIALELTDEDGFFKVAGIG